MEKKKDRVYPSTLSFELNESLPPTKGRLSRRYSPLRQKVINVISEVFILLGKGTSGVYCLKDRFVLAKNKGSCQNQSQDCNRKGFHRPLTTGPLRTILHQKYCCRQSHTTPGGRSLLEGSFRDTLFLPSRARQTDNVFSCFPLQLVALPFEYSFSNSMPLSFVREKRLFLRRGVYSGKRSEIFSTQALANQQ